MQTAVLPYIIEQLELQRGVESVKSLVLEEARTSQTKKPAPSSAQTGLRTCTALRPVWRSESHPFSLHRYILHSAQ